VGGLWQIFYPTHLSGCRKKENEKDFKNAYITASILLNKFICYYFMMPANAAFSTFLDVHTYWP